MKTAMVWNIPASSDPLPYGAHIGTHSLASVCEMDVLWWPSNFPPPPEVNDYDCLIVNLFEDMTHVEQIRQQHPRCYIVALPDAYFNSVFINTSVSDMQFLTQLQAADCIGYISESNRQLYGALFPNKPTVKIPMPIGDREYFEDIRQQAKEDFIITCDHKSEAGERPIDYSVQNVAACAAIQRATGLHVVYVNAATKTRQYAEFAGLRADFHGYLTFEDYAEVSARARLGVDMYALHGFGRNTLMYAYAGTPAVGSSYNAFNVTALDPWLPMWAVEAARRLIENAGNYTQTGIELVEHDHSFDACRRQMTDVLAQVEQWQRESNGAG